MDGCPPWCGSPLILRRLAPGFNRFLAQRAIVGPARGGGATSRRTPDATALRARQRLPAHGSRRPARARRVARGLRRRGPRRALVPRRARGDVREPTAAPAAVPAPAGRGAVRSRPALLDRRPELRPRLPPATHRSAIAR